MNCGISGCSNEASDYCHSSRCGLHCTMKGCSKHDNDDLPEPEPIDHLAGDECYDDLPDDECGAKNGIMSQQETIQILVKRQMTGTMLLILIEVVI